MSVSFAEHIVPLFGARDISCMARYDVPLTDYSYMSDATGNETFADHANARNVYAHLAATATPRLPTGGPYWPAARMQSFEQWMTTDFKA